MDRPPKMEEKHRDRRRYIRHRVEIAFDENAPLLMLRAPELSPDPIVPIDISAAGFCIIALYRPRRGEPFPLSIQTGKSAQVECRARVIWAEEKPGLMAPCWKMGISLEFERGQRERFFAILENYLAAKKENGAISA